MTSLGYVLIQGQSGQHEFPFKKKVRAGKENKHSYFSTAPSEMLSRSRPAFFRVPIGTAEPLPSRQPRGVLLKVKSKRTE